MTVCPTKTQISLGNQQNDCASREDSDQPGHPPSLISLRCVLSGYLKNPSFLHADREDSDQTGQMPRLICLRWVHTPFCLFCHEVAHIFSFHLENGTKVEV